MGKKVIVIGIGGHGKVVADIVCASGDALIGFLDDNPKHPRKFADFLYWERWKIKLVSLKSLLLWGLAMPQTDAEFQKRWQV
jgi:saccharopine dehydrogenase-like NADP-dependent oxidoreductase